jgi:hypothetical protein
MSSPLECLYRRVYDPGALLAAHPPRLRHPHKQLAFELACPPGAVHAGPITVTRWRAAPLPETAALAPTTITAVAGFFDYADEPGTAWHLNFADPELFVAYGSHLLAQDELQCVEHPLLGSIREALLAEKLPARTEENLEPTPVLVAGVERRCTLDTAPDFDAGRLYGLYGNRFGAAHADLVRGALHLHAAPRRSNLIAIAAPANGRGPYFPAQIARILTTAYTGFAAAIAESHGAPVTIHTGFWGCGAFGGNRTLMSLLQLLAARLAGVDRLVFHAAEGLGDFEDGAAELDDVLGEPGEPLAALLERIDDLDYEWGVSNGT